MENITKWSRGVVACLRSFFSPISATSASFLSHEVDNSAIMERIMNFHKFWSQNWLILINGIFSMAICHLRHKFSRILSLSRIYHTPSSSFKLLNSYMLHTSELFSALYPGIFPSVIHDWHKWHFPTFHKHDRHFPNRLPIQM